MKYVCVLLFLIGFFVCGLVASFYEYTNYTIKPKAIDVYRGKTTLEITYKDGVPVDSVVVFKTEKK